MIRYSAEDASCFVFTFKEGLLSKVAHDLKLRVTRFEIEIEPGGTAVSAELDPRSIEVVCAMQGGEPRRGTLSAKDKRKIEANIVSDVLRVRRFPHIAFISESIQGSLATGFRVRGRLEICGRQRSLTVEFAARDDRLEGEVEIHQPDFGIKPFSAMLGTLKVAPTVRVQLSVPKPTEAVFGGD